MKLRVSWRTARVGVLLLLLLFLTAGCGLFSSNDALEEIDVPVNQSDYEDEPDGTGEENEREENEAESVEVETVARELYLLNESGIIVPQTVELPKTESVATQVLEYLVKDGPVTNILPNGFEPILPAGTEVIGMNLEEDGTIVVDLSEEFGEYQAEDEQQIIQALTFTLTQFDNVDRVKLWINGHEQTEMPVNGTPLTEGYSRANGINIFNVDGVDLMNSKAVTVYYPTQQGQQFYYVPVTQHVELKEENLYLSVVQALLDGPSYDWDLLHVFNPNATVVDEPTLADGVLNLTFSEEILSDVNQGFISDEVMETLVLTLTDQPDVSAVSINVENVDQVFNEHGVPYNEPVSREAFVPTGSL